MMIDHLVSFVKLKHRSLNQRVEIRCSFVSFFFALFFYLLFVWLFSICIVNEHEKKNKMTRFFFSFFFEWISDFDVRRKMNGWVFFISYAAKYLHEANSRKGYLTAINIFDKIAHKNQSQIIKIINLYRAERWMQKYRIGNGNNVQFVFLILIDSINLRMWSVLSFCVGTTHLWALPNDTSLAHLKSHSI